MIVDNLIESINKGKSGLNVGLKTGLPKLDSLTYGLQRKWFTVIAGDSGRDNMNISAVFMGNHKDYYGAKTVKAEMLIPC